MDEEEHVDYEVDEELDNVAIQTEMEALAAIAATAPPPAPAQAPFDADKRAREPPSKQTPTDMKMRKRARFDSFTAPLPPSLSQQRGKIVVTGYAPSTSSVEIQKVFNKVGKVYQVIKQMHRTVVEFVDKDDAERALAEFQDKPLFGADKLAVNIEGTSVEPSKKRSEEDPKVSTGSDQSVQKSQPTGEPAQIAAQNHPIEQIAQAKGDSSGSNDVSVEPGTTKAHAQTKRGVEVHNSTIDVKDRFRNSVLSSARASSFRSDRNSRDGNNASRYGPRVSSNERFRKFDRGDDQPRDDDRSSSYSKQSRSAPESSSRYRDNSRRCSPPSIYQPRDLDRSRPFPNPATHHNIPLQTVLFAPRIRPPFPLPLPQHPLIPRPIPPRFNSIAAPRHAAPWDNRRTGTVILPGSNSTNHSQRNFRGGSQRDRSPYESHKSDR